MTVAPIEGRTTAADIDVTIAVLSPVIRPALRLCRCGHEEDAHEHFRGGHDCGVCSSAHCRAFRLRTGRRARSSARR